MVDYNVIVTCTTTDLEDQCSVFHVGPSPTPDDVGGHKAKPLQGPRSSVIVLCPQRGAIRLELIQRGELRGHVGEVELGEDRGRCSTHCGLPVLHARPHFQVGRVAERAAVLLRESTELLQDHLSYLCVGVQQALHELICRYVSDKSRALIDTQSNSMEVLAFYHGP